MQFHLIDKNNYFFKSCLQKTLKIGILDDVRNVT